MKPVTGLIVLLLGLSSLMAFTVHAQERLQLEGTSISGNLELPSTDADVPWAATRTMKQKTGSVIMFKGYVLGKKYTPINANIFERQLERLEMEH